MAGQEFTTTFSMDFRIAEHFGAGAIRSTFTRAFREWRSDYRYLTDLVLFLNRRLAEHYMAGREALASLYDSMWSEADGWAVEHLQGEELRYFQSMTD